MENNDVNSKTNIRIMSPYDNLYADVIKKNYNLICFNSHVFFVT